MNNQKTCHVGEINLNKPNLNFFLLKKIVLLVKILIFFINKIIPQTFANYIN